MLGISRGYNLALSCLPCELYTSYDLACHVKPHLPARQRPNLCYQNAQIFPVSRRVQREPHLTTRLNGCCSDLQNAVHYDNYALCTLRIGDSIVRWSHGSCSQLSSILHQLSSSICSVIMQHLFSESPCSCNTFYVSCAWEPVVVFHNTQWPGPRNPPFLHSQPQTTTSTIAILFMRLSSIVQLQCSSFVLIHQAIIFPSDHCSLSIHHSSRGIVHNDF